MYSVVGILPRYGASLGGGAETLTRELLLQAKACGIISHLEFWTTCAKDHRTWENALPAGVTEEDGVKVRRFPVDPRDLEVFLQAEFSMRDGFPLTIDEQLDWMANSVNSAGLYEHIKREGQNWDCLIFAPYLFATTFWGALIHPERSVLIPCLHNERYAYQQVFTHLFRTVRGLIFNAAPEGELARNLYHLENLEARSGVVGMGFDGVPRETRHLQSEKRRPYLLYSGRKEQGKNLDLLIEAYESEALSKKLDLVLIGAGEINFRETLPEGVTDLGFVSEEEKRALMAGAFALCQPSVNESFSIVLMEAWQHGVPVIVHGNCDVTRHHAVVSGGGLYFTTAPEFGAVVRELAANEELRVQLGAAGKHYVETEYSWDAVLARFAKTLEKLAAHDEPDSRTLRAD